MRFRARIELAGKTATGFEVPAAVVGDKLDVDVELDTATREAKVPADFARALTRDAAARRFFEGLSFSNKQRIVISIEAAKAPETRERRIAKAVTTLREGRI